MKLKWHEVSEEGEEKQLFLWFHVQQFFHLQHFHLLLSQLPISAVLIASIKRSMHSLRAVFIFHARWEALHAYTRERELFIMLEIKNKLIKSLKCLVICVCGTISASMHLSLLLMLRGVSSMLIYCDLNSSFVRCATWSLLHLIKWEMQNLSGKFQEFLIFFHVIIQEIENLRLFQESYFFNWKFQDF